MAIERETEQKTRKIDVEELYKTEKKTRDGDRERNRTSERRREKMTERENEKSIKANDYGKVEKR
jgi:hypothetical protein